MTWQGPVLLLVVAVALFSYWRQATRAHQRRLDQLDVRVHVNGIRGKSTVTRLLAGVLREGGFATVAKTTGSAARVIGPTGLETRIKRRGAPTIIEQVDVAQRHVTPGVDALVIECMAVRPIYQAYSQDFLVRSDITVITNIREDHQEEMGETLDEIADSLAMTIPHHGVVITAEDRPHLRARLARRAAERGSRLVYADPSSVSDLEMAGFDYLQFKENVAIGLAVAEIVGVSRQAAMRGMWKAVPDVGVVRLHTYDLLDKRVLWVPMFAANDRESVVLTFETLASRFPEDAPVIGILNNRLDRGRRAELFAQMVPTDLADHLDHVVTFGAYEALVTDQITTGGYPAERVHNLGDTVQPDLSTIVERLAALVPGTDAVLVGMVNIHTPQAEMLIEHFHELRADLHVDELEQSADPRRAPLHLARMHADGTRHRTDEAVAT